MADVSMYIVCVCTHRITDGGGVRSSVVDQQHFIFSYSQYIISTISLALRARLRVSCTLDTPS